MNMILKEEKYDLNGKSVVLRSPREDEAKMFLDYFKTVTGQTRFLMIEPDEADISLKEEVEFIKSYNNDDKRMLIGVFVDGKYIGNCSFTYVGISRRSKHRASIGVAFYLKYTNQGIGSFVLKRLIEILKENGFEKAELSVIEGNDRAYHVYKKLGFEECGRIHNSYKYDDGTYADEIMMEMLFDK